jgi:flagellar protein FliS
VCGASPVQLVIRLYEQIIEDLRQALNAIEQSQIELRTNKINHAILVIGHLQSRLHFEAGGKPARNLDTFYNLLRHNLMQAQFRASKEMLSRQITDLLEVRAAWLEVERSGNPAANGTVEAATPTAAAIDSVPLRADWKS